MAITTHGHHIPGSPLTEEDKKASRYRCGGPKFCHDCDKDVLGWRLLVDESKEEPEECAGYFDGVPTREKKCEACKRRLSEHSWFNQVIRGD